MLLWGRGNCELDIFFAKCVLVFKTDSYAHTCIPWQMHFYSIVLSGWFLIYHCVVLTVVKYRGLQVAGCYYVIVEVLETE